LDNHHGLLDNIQQAAEEYYKSIRNFVAPKKANHTKNVKKYFFHEDTWASANKSSKNISQAYHHLTCSPTTHLPQQETNDPELLRKAQLSIPGGYIQSPVYQRIRGIEPEDESEEEAEESSNSEEGEETERTGIGKGIGKEKKLDSTTEFQTPEPEVGLQGIKIPKPPTLTGDGNNRTEIKVEAWIHKVNDFFRLARVS